MKSYSQLMKDFNKPLEIKIDISKVISAQMKLSPSIVKKGIKQHQLTINNKPFHFHEIILRPNILIKFQGIPINIETYEKNNEFDKFVDLVLHELNTVHISELRSALKKPFCSYVIAYLANHNYETVNISDSIYFENVIIELESLYKDYFREDKDMKVPKKKELIQTLVKHRTDSLKELSDVVSNLTNGFFTKSVYKFLQEYTKAINQVGFLQLIAPLLSNSIYSRPSIDSLLKPIHEAQQKGEVDEKFIHFESHNILYTSYLRLIDVNNDIHKRVFKKIGDFLFVLFKKECETAEVKPAIISITSTSRKYNFTNAERKTFNLFLNIHNSGEGLARDVKIEALNDTFKFDQYIVGILKPGEVREIILAAAFTGNKENQTLDIRIDWRDSSGSEKEVKSTITFQSQNADVPWSELERRKPYTIQEIEERKKLYGRDQILSELELNILSDKIESYKIWGQKRVGKSSIVKTLRTIFNDHEKVVVVWRPIAGLKNIDPYLTLNTLGESLCSEIFEEIDRKISNPSERERLRSVQVPEFNGSLFPLENYIKQLRRVDSQLKFIFILDEFDRINEEFFLPGNLGDSFSLNVGKGLNSLSFIGFILVGSENMHLLDRQEMNYNNFQGREVDTFDKKTEFDSFKNIITGPVNPYISYTSDAIENIYDVTNGNPYFANLICSNVFKICSTLKDNEVDTVIANNAINMIVESSQKSHFEHFWGDGITDDSTVKKERKADIRRRILVSYSLVYFQTKSFANKEQILKGFKKPIEFTVEQYEIENTITEFFNRKIFFDDSNGIIRIKPALFEKWLCGPGRTLMIEGVSDLEALQREKQLEAEHSLKQDEIQRICDNLIFKGEKLKPYDVTKYLNQFGGPFQQRRIFKLLDSLYYIPKYEITEFIKKEQKNIFWKSELSIKSGVSAPKRENVEIYSFPSTLKENVEIVETFKAISLVRSSKTLKDLVANKEAWRQNGADDIIIFESIIDDFTDIHTGLTNFLDEKIIAEKVPVKLVVLVITTKAKADLIKATSTIPSFKLIHFKEVEDSKVKPFISTTEMFENSEEANSSFAEVKKHYNKTSRESLSVLFETHCPGKSIPILWSDTRQFKSLFPNPNGGIYEEKPSVDGEEYRDRVYSATKQFIQAVNPFLIGYLRKKAKSAGFDNDENWFSTEYVPVNCIKSITDKWAGEGCKHPKETYFDLIDYKEVVKKNKELMATFQISDKSGGSGLEWLDTINEIRRTAAHQEKPPPTLPQTIYFEQKKDEILKRIANFPN
jgi:hypothetical protein